MGYGAPALAPAVLDGYAAASTGGGCYPVNVKPSF